MTLAAQVTIALSDNTAPQPPSPAFKPGKFHLRMSPAGGAGQIVVSNLGGGESVMVDMMKMQRSVNGTFSGGRL